MKIAIILGTRPEIIKLSPIIRKIEQDKINYFMIHTNQHFSENMDKIFFKELNLSIPKYNLNVNSCPHGEMIGRMLIDIEKILLYEKPNVVLIQGDTNSVLAGALASSKLGIKIGHIEAGLRSFDKNMSEEINRIITDHISDYLFVPTKNAKNNLLNEGIDEQKIFIVGNTIVDAIYQNINLCSKIKRKKNYFLITLHRPSNTDNKNNLKNIMKGFELIYKKNKIPFIFPLHPRTKKKIEEFNIKIPKGVEVTEPLGYLDFLNLERGAKLILTDSGGIQEEACILNIPCITLRENTERPETLSIKANILVGNDYKKMFLECNKFLDKKIKWENPFGNGNASKKIINIVNF